MSLQKKASHFGGGHWNSAWHNCPLLPLDLQAGATRLMGTCMAYTHGILQQNSSEGACETKRKKWVDGISWRPTRSFTFLFVLVQDFLYHLDTLQSYQCQDTLLNRQSLLCSSCDSSWLGEVSHSPRGQHSHVQKLFTGRSRGQKFRKPGGNLPRKYLQCCIYIVPCPMTCMKENAVRVVIEFNHCILQFSPSGLRRSWTDF